MLAIEIACVFIAGNHPCVPLLCTRAKAQKNGRLTRRGLDFEIDHCALLEGERGLTQVITPLAPARNSTSLCAGYFGRRRHQYIHLLH